MIECNCQERHHPRRIVLTGGPGAGKTAVIELVRQYFCRHVEVLPEAASILFKGGFPRSLSVGGRQAAQRAIFYVQRELENVADVDDNHALVLCDRGTVDGFAYWSGERSFWESMGTTRDESLKRYDAVIHLRTPQDSGGYNRANPVRIESALEAAIIDERLVTAWEGHPGIRVVENEANFLVKANRTLKLLRAEVPPCCLKGIDAASSPGPGL